MSEPRRDRAAARQLSRECVTDEVFKEILSTRCRLGRYDKLKGKITYLKPPFSRGEALQSKAGGIKLKVSF